MANKVPTKTTIEKRTIDNMKKLGTYKEEYQDIIKIYVDTYYNYLLARSDFYETGRKYETTTAAGNPKKSAIIDTIEKSRKDLLAYSDRLGLNPKALETITTKPTITNQSKLAAVLSELK